MYAIRSYYATGRELAIEGDLSISIWPALGVKVEKVRFSNAPGAAEPELATMDTLVVGDASARKLRELAEELV